MESAADVKNIVMEKLQKDARRKKCQARIDFKEMGKTVLGRSRQRRS